MRREKEDRRLLLEPEAPPREIYSGTLGRPLIVLSTAEVRIAERAEAEAKVATADGPVTARPGDFIVSMSTGERYPIAASIYLGTYEVLSQVGSSYIGRRLQHPRVAWPVISPGADLTYGPGRGTVAVTRGGWIYKSDDADFGAINKAAQELSYVVVGAAGHVRSVNWRARLLGASQILIILPPVLTALALFALYWSASRPVLADLALAVELALLAAGAALTWWIRRNRWSLRAATSEGLDDARDFQVAAEALGFEPSEEFPTMVLWRAGQDKDSTRPLQTNPDRVKSIKSRIDDLHERIQSGAHHHHRGEFAVEIVSWLSVAVMFTCLLLVGVLHWTEPKLIAIWLPSVVGAAHSWASQRQSLRRLSASAEVLRELRFVRSKLAELTPGHRVDASSSEELTACLRMICLCVARHAQRELQLGTERRPMPPG